jgi:hypothetical protein
MRQPVTVDDAQKPPPILAFVIPCQGQNVQF